MSSQGKRPAGRRNWFQRQIGCTMMLLLFPLVSLAPSSSDAGTTIRGCSLSYTGLTPLTDLGTGAYYGFEGGLYPGGSNVSPWRHEQDGVAAANRIQPLDANGNPDPINGKIVLISVGMSNASLEFETSKLGTPFKRRADADPAKNLRLVIVNGAQGGQTADVWADPTSAVWQVVDDRLSEAGVTPNQVQVAWVKQADPQPQALGAFPDRMLILHGELEATARNLKQRYPNIQIAYYSSRTRAYAYTDDPSRGFLNPEPMAYESGFAVKWMVETYIRDSAFRQTVPYLAWGPYLWIDGLGPDNAEGGLPGRSDGFEWRCVQGDDIISDVRTDDYTHPGGGGVEKVGHMLLRFFKTDVTATPWFLAPN